MDDDLKKYARNLGVDPQYLLRWRQGFRKMNPNCNGRPKGRLSRPVGWISVGDAILKYKTTCAILQQLRRDGLSVKVDGTMILMNESELRERLRKTAP